MCSFWYRQNSLGSHWVTCVAWVLFLVFLSVLSLGLRACVEHRMLELQTEFKGSVPCLPLPRVSCRLAGVLGKRAAGKMGWAGLGRAGRLRRTLGQQLRVRSDKAVGCC